MVPLSHPPIVVDGRAHSLQPLDAFEVSMLGKGVAKGSDLRVQVCFSNHVFTERSKHGDARHVKDHNGIWRYFDPDRYEMSKDLPALLKSAIGKDALAFPSRSFGGLDNLILLETKDGQSWAIVFCFEPHEVGVQMQILSAHPKPLSKRNVRRDSLSYFARKCAFQKERIPKD